MTDNERKKGRGVSFVRKAGKTMLILLCVICGFFIVLAGLLLVVSPGRIQPFLDENGKPLAGAVSEKIRVDINGVKQGMFIRGKDRGNPVLLFLHGGPGMPEFFLNRAYPTDIEDYFTVVWWEQRGAGLSYNPEALPETITLEQIAADTIAVTEYLRNRFGKEKIYLLGHSGGSFIGLKAAALAPELYYAYLGMAQITRQLESEKLAYEYMLTKYGVQGNTKMIRRLEETPAEMTVPLPMAYMRIRDAAMHGLGVGTTKDMKSVLTGIFLPIWGAREYTIGEKMNIWRGKWSAYNKTMWNRILETDLTVEIKKLDIPVYFFHGVHDYTVNYAEAKRYFSLLSAPVKGFYSFQQSAHSPLFEEPEKMRQILTEDVLAGLTGLADSN